MTTTVKIDLRSSAAKSLVAFLRTLSFVKIEEEGSLFNEETEKAITEARAGIGLTKTKSHSDLMKKLRS